MASYGKPRFELILRPVSGKAVPVYQGEVLRISLLEGPECVDFNCFNLHDYKEHMAVGHSRDQGFRLKEGHILFSNPPRYNPMLAIIEMSETCLTDLLGSRCNALYWEMIYGFDIHTNCQDTLAECIGEYGLTPDDVHDSFNMWMNTGWDDEGRYIVDVRRNPGKKGDHIDLLALTDVLAVPVVCGSGDTAITSNYWLKPIKIQIFEPSDETKRLTQAYLNRYAGWKNQRTVNSFRIKEIRTERELKPIPRYKPHFVNFPLKIQEVAIELTGEDYKNVQHLKMRGLGEDDEDAVRSAVMEWYNKNRAEGLFWGPWVE